MTKTPQSEANRRALEARRERLAEELRQMVADAGHWNRTHPDEEPIIVDVNLEPDVAKLLASGGGSGDPACLGCQKVWRHHHTGEAGTVCALHNYGPAYSPGLKEPTR